MGVRVMSQPFLQMLAPEARELLLAAARPVSFVKGATLVRHGEEAARGQRHARFCFALSD